MVQNHLTIWLAMHDDGTRCGISSVTEMEFRWYLQCGNLAHGFARARCTDCGHDFMIAFSSKGRDVCSSCTTPRDSTAPDPREKVS